MDDLLPDALQHPDRDTRSLAPVSEHARAESALRALELLGKEQGIQTFRGVDGRVEVVVLDERGDGKLSAFGCDLFDAVCQAACIVGLERG